jgi:formate hydrogenlyase subunit 3/multisubunit Na+/H+ antiporter MnhD subunit
MRYLRGLRAPKVLAAILLGGAAFVASFLIAGTPEHSIGSGGGGTQVMMTNTHPIDVILFVFRVGGGLALIIGVLALIAYARGEMDTPAEAVPPGAHTTDDRLPPSPPPHSVGGFRL